MYRHPFFYNKNFLYLFDNFFTVDFGKHNLIKHTKLINYFSLKELDGILGAFEQSTLLEWFVQNKY